MELLPKGKIKNLFVSHRTYRKHCILILPSVSNGSAVFYHMGSLMPLPPYGGKDSV
jgi:hypothetical protein